MASLDPQIIVYDDLLSHLIRGQLGGARTKEQEEVKESVINAYDNICLKHEWEFYKKEYRIHLSAPYSTGTIAYDHTGGSSERLVTLTGGTFPTWAKYGRLRVSNFIHDVETNPTTTTLTLHSILNPGEDIAALTTYEIYRSVYPLPEDMLSMESVTLESSLWQGWYITPAQWLERERVRRASGSPVVWTMMRDPDQVYEFVMIVDPPPDTAEPLAFTYTRRPRALRWSGIENPARTGTLTGTAAAGTVTTAGALPASMAGSILRIGDPNLDTSKPPTGRAGSNPFVEQHRIKTISGTTVTLDGTTLDYTYSTATRFIVSDPIDASYSMLNAIRAEARALLSEYGDGVEKITLLRSLAKEALITAMENDQRADVRSLQGRSTFDYFRQPTITQE